GVMAGTECIGLAASAPALPDLDADEVVERAVTVSESEPGVAEFCPPSTGADPGCGASRNADAGRPPGVCASAALKAYGPATTSVRGCSGSPSPCTPSHNAWPLVNSDGGIPSARVLPSITV